ncbi:MAG: hypothetical protein Q8N63_08940 [Nanoarchaeota archaeon]|nr:hypothetical protein [Nanoarchaeota archaeon]
MAGNELARIACSNKKGNGPETPNVQYVDVKRIRPEDHWSIRVLEFYNDIQRIMNEPIGEKLNYRA